MAEVQTETKLLKLSETGLVLANPGEDVRGFTVVDQSGQEIGSVEDLMIDSLEKKVRFLEVGAGGFLGLGERKFAIPVDAIARIDESSVHIEHTREHVTGSPAYDPELSGDTHYWEAVYGYFGYAPYWGPGYVFPYFP